MTTQTTRIRLGRPTIRMTQGDGTVTEHQCPPQPLPPAPKRSGVGTIVALVAAILCTAALAHALGAGPGGVFLASSVIPIAFKRALFSGRAWKAALYVGAANLSNSTTGYLVANEVVGAGYIAGGKTLTEHVIDGADGVSVILDFDDQNWTAASFTARYILIYDNNAANKEGFVIDMGQDQQISGGTFEILFPAPELDTAIMVAA